MQEQSDTMWEVVRLILQFAIVPIAGFMGLHYRTTQKHASDIAVMREVHQLVKENHDREFKEVKESFKQVMDKLSEIEKALRK